MADTDLLKNTRNTRNTTGMGWGFSLCAADEGDSDSELEDASVGSHSSLVPSPDPPVSEELRLVRDLDLGARQDLAIFKSNPWTIAKLRAATRKPPSNTHCAGPSALLPAPHQVPASASTSKARSILDPQLKTRVLPQHSLYGKKPPRQQKKLSPPRTKRVLNPPAMPPNPYSLPGLPPTCLDPLAARKSDKFAEAISTQPRTFPVKNCTSREQEGIQPSSLGTRSKGPPFSSPVSVSPVPLLGHIDPSLSPVKQSSLHSTVHIAVSPNRFSFPDRLPDPLAFLCRSPTRESSHGPPTASPIKHRSSGALSVNRAGTKRKRWPSPPPPTRSVGNQTPNHLLSVMRPAERILLPKTPHHRQRASPYDSRVFTSSDGEWSTLPQNKSRVSISKTLTPFTQNSFRIPSLKLPGIGNQTYKKSWLLTTFQPPPSLKVPNLISTSEARENLKEDDARIALLETMNSSSSQTVVENENDEQVSLDRLDNKPPLSAS